MAEKFDNLEEHLEKFVENIRQLGIIVSDFQPSSQTGLNQKLWVVICFLNTNPKHHVGLNKKYLESNSDVFSCRLSWLNICNIASFSHDSRVKPVNDWVIYFLRNFMITGLQDIEKCRQQLHDINVPLEVFEWVLHFIMEIHWDYFLNHLVNVLLLIDFFILF